jgi:Cys-tRNA(Pro) deacylase
LKYFARQIGVKKVEPSKPEVAERHTGYQVGGTSPFGMRKVLPVYVERSILGLPSIYINGGHRGFLVQISPKVLIDLLEAQPVDSAASA